MHIFSLFRIDDGMNIGDLKRGTRAVVTAVKAPPLWRERLRALGIERGGEISLLKRFPRGRTYLVAAAGSTVALGREVAECVLVRTL